MSEENKNKNKQNLTKTKKCANTFAHTERPTDILTCPVHSICPTAETPLRPEVMPGYPTLSHPHKTEQWDEK